MTASAPGRDDTSLATAPATVRDRRFNPVVPLCRTATAQTAADGSTGERHFAPGRDQRICPRRPCSGRRHDVAGHGRPEPGTLDGWSSARGVLGVLLVARPSAAQRLTDLGQLVLEQGTTNFQRRLGIAQEGSDFAVRRTDPLLNFHAA